MHSQSQSISKTVPQLEQAQLELSPQPNISSQESTNTPRDEHAPSRILVVSEFPIVRLGFIRIASSNPEFVVCGEADTHKGAIEAVQALKPSLAIIDITASGRIELIREISEEFDNVPILAFSLSDNRACAERAFRAGARGYVTKDDCSEKLCDALSDVVGGKIYAPAALSDFILNWAVTGKPTSAVDSLSDRQFEVLRRIGAGECTRQIAEDLDLSVKTVETHCANLKEKLHLKNAPELACFAAKWVIQSEQENSQPRL